MAPGHVAGELRGCLAGCGKLEVYKQLKGCLWKGETPQLPPPRAGSASYGQNPPAANSCKSRAAYGPAPGLVRPSRSLPWRSALGSFPCQGAWFPAPGRRWLSETPGGW
ncbi:hypothetical protein KIL84_001966 [Mauremys mutica]|uniref:Uncharacterized protein n=1 Tax=Mauremys mutica TaxID=74926 RepID=A0A9D4AYB1_9SAUR|nr:hypothetical protein KIL84_001966 [Mauremys mutica]